MQRKLKILIVLSLLILLMPFVGIPVVWKPWIAALFALGIIVLSYKLLRDRVASKQQVMNQAPVDDHEPHA